MQLSDKFEIKDILPAFEGFSKDLDEHEIEYAIQRCLQLINAKLEEILKFHDEKYKSLQKRFGETLNELEALKKKIEDAPIVYEYNHGSQRNTPYRWYRPVSEMSKIDGTPHAKARLVDIEEIGKESPC